MPAETAPRPTASTNRPDWRSSPWRDAARMSCLARVTPRRLVWNTLAFFRSEKHAAADSTHLTMLT